MFLPFLPFILALGALTAIVAMPDPPPPAMSAWQVWVSWGVLLVIGALMGRLPSADEGAHSPMRFGLRRALLFGIWLIVVASLNLYTELRVLLGGTPDGAGLGSGGWSGEAAMLLLLVNYWLADGLSLRTPMPSEGAAGLTRLASVLRIPLPVIVLFALATAGSRLVDSFFALGEAGVSPSTRMMLSLGLFGVVMVIAVPWLIRVCWGFRRLEQPEAERVIGEELEANGIHRTPVFLWPEQVMGATTASVIGLLPPFRYMLIGRSIAENLTAPELRSVTAHEAAHVRHRHLWYYLAAIFAFILLVQVLLDGLVVGSFLAGMMLPVWVWAVLEIAGLLLFLRFGIGLLSRHFERQADGDAFRRHGLAAFQGALAKVGTLNRIPAGADNWHHYGINRRVGYLLGAEQDAATLNRHDGRVRRIKWAVLGVLLVGLVAQPLMAGANWLPLYAEHVLAERLDGITDPGAAELSGVQYLASQAFQAGEHDLAERYFRVLLSWRPEDPKAQNNLAWLLVTRPDAAPNELREGLTLAERATEARQAAYIWDTLAEAYHRLEQHAKAEAAADRALRLAEAGRERGDAPLSYYRERWETFTQWRRDS